MTLHHLQQRTHPLGFDWLIPQGGQDEGYVVGSFESQLHTTHTRVRFFSPATSGAPQRPTLQDQRDRTRGLQLVFTCNNGQPDCLRQLGNLHNHRSIYDCIAFDRSEYIPGSARTFAPELLLRVHSPGSCTWPILPSRQL